MYIPHGSLTVITGLSGSGKSSLAFDTLYAEGQRRYIESLSSYARQFLGKLEKPDLDYIKGIAPAIAIEQKVNTSNPRSTVGTTTEIYDYLKILFTKLGRTYSPISGKEVKKHRTSDVIDALNEFEKGSKVLILSSIRGFKKYGIERQLEILKQQGYVRLFCEGKMILIDEALADKKRGLSKAELVIDRVQNDFESEEQLARIADSVETAFIEGDGACSIVELESGRRLTFSNRFEEDGILFQEPSEHFFTFNNPMGACTSCEGFGQVIGINPDLVIPNRNKSIFDYAVVPWIGEKMDFYRKRFISQTAALKFPVHRPIQELTEDQLDLLWNGNKDIDGIYAFFDDIQSQAYKIQYRVMLSRYRGRTECPDCKSTRLRKDASYVKIHGKSIVDVVLLPIQEVLPFMSELSGVLPSNQVTKRILPEIIRRLEVLEQVGLGYLTLNRAANTLSGGESQRINLVTSLGSSLVGALYVLDEPSIGLHSRDTDKLIAVLKELRRLGNTVVVVEHDEAIIQAADYVIDMGPEAGRFGGELVYSGPYKDLINAERSLTAAYLKKDLQIPVPQKRRIRSRTFGIRGACLHNLKSIDVELPLNALVCISGVSGSGKSTLVRDILYPAVRQILGQPNDYSGTYGLLTGNYSDIKKVEFIDQNPIGKSSRSNPATYVKAYDDIRELFSRQHAAKIRGYTPGFFSFNVEGGRCEVCEGEGIINVSMQFMADIQLRCDQCQGTRFKQETLEVKYRDKSIAAILELDIQEACAFFGESNDKLEERIVMKLKPFIKVGLGYLKLGQSSSTLSGGEAQRVKLASFLIKMSNEAHTLFVFDEPTTGLHFHDIAKLVIAFNELVNQGHSVLVIEHNLDVLKAADYIIDLGPEGGKKGGNLVFAGTPEDLIKCGKSQTAPYLAEKLMN